ncbi:MAG: hypothetical protein P4M13_06755 [Alphaproteobacteria bacterium]|nr:hypothetical protein [Alphaproteobacteria bacterium]
MSYVAIKQSSYIPTKARLAILLLIFLLFSGALQLTAVREMNSGVECRDENQYLLTENGNYLVTENGNRIILEQKQRQCQLGINNFLFPLPSWTEIQHIVHDEFVALKNAHM